MCCMLLRASQRLCRASQNHLLLARHGELVLKIMLVPDTPEGVLAKFHLTAPPAECQGWQQSMDRPDSMAQWQDCWPECWEAWGPEFKPRLGREGVRFLYKLGQSPKTFIYYSLLPVAQIEGVIILESFIFISFHNSCCVVCIKKMLSFYMSEPPLKKGWRTLYEI